MMSSTSFGNPSAMHHHGVRPNAVSSSTPAARVVGQDSPTRTILTRNDDGGSGHVSPSATLQRHQNFVHDASSPQRALPHHQHHHQRTQDVIELTDSDTDSASQNKNASSGTVRRHQPFDPIPRPAPRSSHRASASPSIASLINFDDNQQKQTKLSNQSPTSSAFFAEPNVNKKPTKPSEAIIENHLSIHNSDTTLSTSAVATATSNSDNINNTSSIQNINSNSNNSQTSAPSPKPSRPNATAGSGNSLFLPGLGPNSDDDFKVPNIYISVPLNGEQNKYVNFTKLAEERYGWAALNPRLARAKLQMDSGDEMMMDGSESESNVEMGGSGEATSEDPKKRQKRKYQDVYDKEDPFIDDSEMLWEEQAAASKDGFFVYSGPLVPEGEKPQIERADGTVKRGRGRGRGARGGTATARATGATARKPRITKKEKEKLEKEKEERERFSVLAAAQAVKGIQPAAAR